MASTTNPSSRGEFERQRGELLKEIAEVSTPLFPTSPLSELPTLPFRVLLNPPRQIQSFDQVLSNVNKLNRNLESVIAVGNEFSSVEALWSTFENVMGKNDHEEGEAGVDGNKNADELPAEADDERSKSADGGESDTIGEK